jgi:hypothetical protein
VCLHAEVGGHLYYHGYDGYLGYLRNPQTAAQRGGILRDVIKQPDTTPHARVIETGYLTSQAPFEKVKDKF